jgi:hypothetical protein
MVEQVTFGRRNVRPPEPALARAPVAPAPVQPESSSADLEAFAASIRAGQASDVDEFARWRRQQAPRRLVMILVRFALLTPGLVCFALHAPWWASTSLEVVGLAANAWLRLERRRQASAIAAWSPDAEAGSTPV